MIAPLLRTWPPLPPDAWLRPPRTPPPFPLAEPGCRWFARGRQALWHGVRTLGLGPGDEVLVPAYHHGSEIEALVRAGPACRFYGGDARLAPDEAELEGLLGARVRALLLVHYLGFPQDAPRWRRWCDRHGLLLLEDAAQAWLARGDDRPVGALGDLAIFCLYKTVGAPDGAVLVVPGGEPRAADGTVTWTAATVARRHAAWFAARSPAAGAAFQALHRASSYDPARDFALEAAAAHVSRAAQPLVARLAHPGVAAGRRARYSALLAELGEQVPAPFDRLPDGASPFAFPLAVDDAPRVADRLRDRGVEALRFWSEAHPALSAPAFPAIAARRRRTIALPVHQELRPADLDRLVAAVRGSARRRAEPRLERIEALGAVREEWTRLAEAVGDPFATWEWAACWCRHLLGDRRAHLQVCRGGDGRVVGILPLYESAAGPLRVLRFVGSGRADRQGPICLPGDRPAVGRALRRALDGPLACDVLLAERLPGEAGWSAFLGGRTVRREASPMLRIDGRSWDELLAARSANFRQQVRGRERRLRRDFTLGFRLAEDPERLSADLAALAALHRARWSDRSDAFDPGRWAFHTDFAAVALREGWLRLWFLELDGRPVAAWHGFRYGGADWFYQAGRDPRCDQLSVGFVLMAHTIREAAADGMRAYHLLRGDEPYKARFAGEDPGLDTLVAGRGARGHAAAAAATMTLRLPAPARRIAARAAGD